MKIRIKFSADLIIEADNMAEVRNKFEGMPLWSKEAQDAGVEYSETLLIEDANTYDDLWADYHNAGEELAHRAE
jgi:hypothetical protein